MKIEYREIIEKDGKKFLRVTTPSERWYIDQEQKDKPFPSVTWIAGCYPKGIGFYRWLANHGWEESQAIKEAAAEKGGRVHRAIDALFGGAELQITDKFPDNDGVEAEFTLEEWECLMSFRDWWMTLKEQGAESIEGEKTIFNHSLWYAGTMDRKVRIGEDVWIFDFKTGQNVWPEHEIQLTAYKHCEGNEDCTRLGIVQIGYRANKRGWKQTEVVDQPELLNAAYTIWVKENSTKVVPEKDYPLSLSLTEPVGAGDPAIAVGGGVSGDGTPAPIIPLKTRRKKQ